MLEITQETSKFLENYKLEKLVQICKAYSTKTSKKNWVSEFQYYSAVYVHYTVGWINMINVEKYSVGHN